MRDICSGLRADPRRATAWRLRTILILVLAGAVAAAFVPRAARAAGYDLHADLGGGCLTGDPDDGEHKTGPSCIPAELTPADGSSGGLATPSVHSGAASAIDPRNTELSLPADGRATLLQVLARYVRPLAWLAMSARQPWACDPLWLTTLQSARPAPALAATSPQAIARTR